MGFDPHLIAGLPVTRPDRYDYVSWPASFNTAYDYTLFGGNVSGDSAGLSFFTREIRPGESVRLTQVIFAAIPNDVPNVPEPTSTFSLLAFGVLGAGWKLKGQQKAEKR